MVVQEGSCRPVSSLDMVCLVNPVIFASAYCDNPALSLRWRSRSANAWNFSVMAHPRVSQILVACMRLVNCSCLSCCRMATCEQSGKLWLTVNYKRLQYECGNEMGRKLLV